MCAPAQVPTVWLATQTPGVRHLGKRCDWLSTRQWSNLVNRTSVPLHIAPTGHSWQESAPIAKNSVAPQGGAWRRCVGIRCSRAGGVLGYSSGVGGSEEGIAFGAALGRGGGEPEMPPAPHWHTIQG